MSTLPSGSYVSKFFFLLLLILRLGLFFYPNGNFPICTFLQDLLSSPTCTLMDILVVAIGVHLACECLLSCFTFSVQLNLSGLFRVIQCRDIMSTASSVLMLTLSVISLLHLHWVFRIVRSVWVENYLVVIQLLHVLLIAVIALQTAVQGVYLMCAQCAHLRGRLITVLRKGKDRFGNQMKLQAFFNIVFGVYTVSLLVITHTSKIELENYELVIFSVCACGQVLYRACCVSVEYHLAQTHTPIHIEESIEASKDPPVPVDVQTAVNDDQSTVRMNVADSNVITFTGFEKLVESEPAYELLKEDNCNCHTVKHKHPQPIHGHAEPQRETNELVCLAYNRHVKKQAQSHPNEQLM